MNLEALVQLFTPTQPWGEPGVRLMVLVAAGALVLGAIGVGVMIAMGKGSKELRGEIIKRTLAWGVMVPLMVVPIVLGRGWAIGLFMALGLLCYREFARATGHFRERWLSVVIVLGIVLLNLAALDHWYGLFVALTPLLLVIVATACVCMDSPKGFVQRVGLSILAVLLFGVCLGHLSYLANAENYRGPLLLLLACVGLNDVFAFCVGKTIGGPKLAPKTSPGKTISGAVGAIVLTTGVFYLLGRVVFAGQVLGAMHHLIVMGMIVSVAGILGDLTISSVKRDVGIKDMGALIPGHGGVLDRCNSLLLAAPALFHYIGYFQGVGLERVPRVLSGGGGG